MVKDYETLLSRYNTNIARANDLQEQLSTKQRQWNQREEAFKKTTHHVQELCISILAKDRTEMILGEEYSWDKLGLDLLVQKATKSFAEYSKTKTDILQKTMDIAEARGEENEGLKDQIRRMMVRGSAGFEKKTAEDVFTEAKKEAEEKESKGKASLTLKELAKNGTIEMVMDDDDEEVCADKTEKELIDIAEKKKLTPGSVPVYDSRKKVEYAEKKREVIAHMVDLSLTENQMNTAMWKTVEVIGKDGLSKYADIEKEILEKVPEQKPSRIRSGVLSLTKMNVISLEKVSLPLSSRMVVYRLTDIGARLYEKQYGTKPVLSELDKIIAEHDNAEHGYGILDVGKILENSGKYKEVSCFNRHRAIKLEGGGTFVPDILCVPNNGKYEEYYEYERGFHTQTDFNAKCEKMIKVTRYLNFIVPNTDVLAKLLRPKLDTWIEKKGIGALKQIKIRATIARNLRDAEDIKLPDAWALMYDLSKGKDPVKAPGLETTT